MNGTNWTGITTFEGMLSEANANVPFWTAMLYMIWIVLVITLLPYGTSVALLTGSFLALILGLLLLYMGLTSLKWILVILAVIIFKIIWDAIFSKKE